MSLDLHVRARLTSLRAQGYRLEISTRGYQAWAPDGAYLGGATSLPRDKPRHWRCAQMDLEMYAASAVTLADSHLAMKGKPA